MNWEDLLCFLKKISLRYVCASLALPVRGQALDSPEVPWLMLDSVLAACLSVFIGESWGMRNKSKKTRLQKEGLEASVASVFASGQEAKAK